MNKEAEKRTYKKFKSKLEEHRKEYKNEIVRQLFKINEVDAAYKVHRIFTKNESHCPCNGTDTFVYEPKLPSLENAFTWSDTEEDHEYWSNIFDKLNSDHGVTYEHR